jgi:hypothetical protein
MKARLLPVGILLFSTAAFGWYDVAKTATIPAGAVYCTSQSNLEAFAGYALDGDSSGADRMVDQGKCILAQRSISVSVFQENSDFANFISPSGKAFYTLKGYLK